VAIAATEEPADGKKKKKVKTSQRRFYTLEPFTVPVMSDGVINEQFTICRNFDYFAAFDTMYRQSADMCDIGRLRGPRRNRSNSRNNVQSQTLKPRYVVNSIREDRLQYFEFARLQTAFDMYVVLEMRTDIRNRIDLRFELLAQFVEAERRLGRRTGQVQHRHG